MKPVTPTHLRSLSQLTTDMQVPYARVVATIDELGIKPAMTLDGRSFYDAAAADVVHKHLFATADKGPGSFRNRIVTK
jgi:hypothetical protein